MEIFRSLEKLFTFVIIIAFIAIFVLPVVAFGLGLLYYAKEAMIVLFSGIIDVAQSIINIF
jgi:hypothetical protein